jgi:hypothetical protein
MLNLVELMLQKVDESKKEALERSDHQGRLSIGLVVGAMFAGLGVYGGLYGVLVCTSMMSS